MPVAFLGMAVHSRPSEARDVQAAVGAVFSSWL